MAEEPSAPPPAAGALDVALNQRLILAWDELMQIIDAVPRRRRLDLGWDELADRRSIARGDDW